MTTVQEILKSDKEVWDASIYNKFIGACKDGTIQKKNFLTWLEQDYQFVEVFTRLAAKALQAAPGEDFDTIMAFIAGIKNEMIWFREQASANGIDFNQTQISPAAEKYIAAMKSWFDLPYPALATAIWAIEYNYYQTWKESGKVVAAYEELRQRWTSDAFGKIVRRLEETANNALRGADKAICDQAAKVFHQVAVLEIEFWDMTMA